MSEPGISAPAIPTAAPTALRFGDAFDAIYATDLIYAPDCWKLCGDAHCCNFARYKSQMGVTSGHTFQELPLLPGEMEFIRARNFDRDFGEFEHRVIDFPLTRGVMKLEFLVSRGKTCACRHDTRTTVCRLYPLLPVFDDGGKMTGVDTLFGMFEHIERLDVLPRACQITSVPFGETEKLLAICNAIGTNPTQVFYLKAFELAKAHATAKIEAARRSVPPGRQVSSFRIFQGLYALKQLLDPAVMRRELDVLANRFAALHGDRFSIS